MARRSLPAFAMALGCALAGAAVYLGWRFVPALERADVHTLQGFLALRSPTTAAFANAAVRLGDPAFYALAGLGLLVAAVRSGRPRTALAVAVVLIGTAVSSQVLKPLLAVPRLVPDGAHVEAGAWPSGHSTAAMALALCLVLVAPAGRRAAAAAIGGCIAVVVIFSVLLLGWHFPSDALGGILLAGAWTSLAVAGLRAAEPRPQPAARAERPLLGFAAGGAALLLGAVLLAIGHRIDVASFAAAHTTFIAGAATLTAGALGLAATLAARAD